MTTRRHTQDVVGAVSELTTSCENGLGGALARWAVWANVPSYAALGRICGFSRSQARRYSLVAHHPDFRQPRRAQMRKIAAATRGLVSLPQILGAPWAPPANLPPPVLQDPLVETSPIEDAPTSGKAA